MNDFRKLKSWEKAHALAVQAYHVTRRFPKEETYGLVAQIRRSASSIPANIAEGYGRGGDAELARYLRIATGSACKLQYHFHLARDLGFLSEAEHRSADEMVAEIKRMLSSFVSKLKADG